MLKAYFQETGTMQQNNTQMIGMKPKFFQTTTLQRNGEILADKLTPYFQNILRKDFSLHVSAQTNLIRLQGIQEKVQKRKEISISFWKDLG